MEIMIKKLVAGQPTEIRSGSRNRTQKIYQIGNWYEKSDIVSDPQLLFVGQLTF